MRQLRRPVAVVAALILAACASGGGPASQVPWPILLASEFQQVPPDAPQRWRGLIGEYGPDSALRWYALERDGRMWILDHQHNYVPLAEQNDSVFQAPRVTAAVAGDVKFSRDESGRATSVTVADRTLQRNRIEPPSGANQLRITPLRAVEELRREALAATPPAETGSFKMPELVDLATLDTTIRFDIRYAGTNNFLGSKLYEQPRAFLQRPAAEALVRAHQVLRRLGYGLLIHDAYRPWYVTRIFWDATPDSVKWLVANPAQGSKHNRGAAVDLTLYDRETGRVVEMPSTYDESTNRAKADYPGGTSQQRWHRALLRKAMEHEGFVANPQEWWHFDFKDWKTYPILNLPFDRVPAVPAKTS
jgi:D-alanyl-D-alanine dipeptidase